MRRSVIIATIAALVVTSCSDDPGTITADERRQVVAELVESVYVRGYERLRAEADGLAGAIDSMCDGSGSVEAARSAWSSTLDAWLATSAFRFGPARDLRLGNSIVYPIDASKVAEAMDTVSDPAGVAELGSDARGLEAIEMVLFTTESPPAHCAYLVGAGAGVAAASADILTGWTAPDGTGAELSTDMGSQDGVEMAVNDLRMSIDDLVFFRLDAGAGGEGLLQPDRAPGNARHIVDSVRLGYLGANDGGLSGLVSIISPDADERTVALLDELERNTAAIVPGDASSAAAALETALELRTLISTEIASLLAATLLLGDADGDA